MAFTSSKFKQPCWKLDAFYLSGVDMIMFWLLPAQVIDNTVEKNSISLFLSYIKAKAYPSALSR